MRYGMLLGHERAGTNLLKNILNTSAGFRCEGEVCKIETEEERSSARNFFNYRLLEIKREPKFAFPIRANQDELIRGYLARLGELNGRCQYTIVDVKYSHLHNFNIFWTSNSARPHLLEFAHANDIRVVHLYRKQALLAVLSNELAIERRVWNTSSKEKLEDRRIVVSLDRVLRDTTKLFEWQMEMKEHCSGLDHLELTYEELMYQGELAPSTSEKLSRYFEVDPDWDPNPSLLKVSPPPEQFVVNLDELRRHFERNGAESLWCI